MDILQHKGKLALLTGALIAAILWLLLMPGGQHGAEAGHGDKLLDGPAEEKSGNPAEEWLDECDDLASHPSDPNRSSAPVPDDHFAPARAIEACEAAVHYNPDNARARFELGRSYWIAHRDQEAFSAFVYSAEQNYPAAMKYIGDAYYLNRGLPESEEPSAATALDWYKKAADGGFADAAEAAATAEEAIRKHRLDPEYFQNGEFMQTLYSGDFANATQPVALAFYTQGLVDELDTDTALFMDINCKSLINVIGKTAVDYSQVAAILMVATQFRKSDGTIDSGKIARNGIDYVAQKFYLDQGKRDATILFNEKKYGCESPVAQTVMKNIMIRIDNSKAK